MASKADTNRNTTGSGIGQPGLMKPLGDLDNFEIARTFLTREGGTL